MTYTFSEGEWSRILAAFQARKSALSPVNRANTAALLAALAGTRTITTAGEAERIIALLLAAAEEEEPEEAEEAVPAGPEPEREREAEILSAAAILERLRLFTARYRAEERGRGDRRPPGETRRRE